MEIQSQHIHSRGPCGISISISSSDLFTVGGDSRVLKHIFQKGTIASSNVADLPFEPVYCVSSVLRKRCYIACSDNVIRSCELDSFVFCEVVMKTTQPIHCLAISHDSNYLAVATKDSKIEIIQLDTRETAFTLMGHQGGVYYIEFDPKDQYLSSMGSDGTLRVWDYKQSKCVTAKPILDKESIERLSSSWSDGGNLVLPHGSKIEMIQSGTWTTLQTYQSKYNNPVELVCSSPNGLYLAYITEHDDLFYLCVIDSRASAEVYSKSLDCDEFNCIRWSEDGRNVLVLDQEVRLSRHEAIDSSLLSGIQSLADENPSKQETESIHESSGVAKIQVDDDSDDDVVVRRHIKRSKPEEEQPEEEENDEDEEGIPTEEAVPFMNDDVDTTVELHPLLMPAASDVVQNRCFLAYNEVGLIVKRAEGSESVIEVEFSDASRKRIVLRDPSSIEAGSLSNEGVVLGGLSEDENGRMTGVVLYRPFRSWTSRGSWRIELPGNEVPNLVACSDSFVYVYTSKGYLRSWHVSGVQRSILTPCSNVVSIVANHDTLAVVYEDSQPVNHSHILKFILYSTSPFRRLYQGLLPISTHSALHWIGFTHEGLFATYDSQCIIRVFTGTEVPAEPIGVEEMEWVVLMNLKHIMKERCAAGEAIPYCWLVALSIKSIKYVYLPSAAIPVPTLPRPMISVMEVDLPLCNKSNPAYANEKSTLLTGYEVSAKSLSDDWEEEESSLLMEFDKLLLRQLNVELGNNQLLKAEYVCSMIHSVAALKKAAYLAQKVESSSLVSRIEEMIEMKEGEVESIPQRRRQEDSFESRIQNEMKREIPRTQPISKRVELEEKQANRSPNVFKRNNVESPVKKSLIGQIHSVVSPLKKNN